MIVTTGNEISGYFVADYLGVIRGIVVRAPNIAQGFIGSLKQIVGGNIEGFTRVMTTTIALETSKGNLELAIGLGILLLALVMGINALAWGVRQWAGSHAG